VKQKLSLKDKKLITQINGKFNGMDSVDENKIYHCGTFI
jgi:hypothetical protein